MITVRFYHTWPLRRAEWMLALVLVGVGIVFALEDDLRRELGFATIMTTLPQWVWATWALSVGLLRLVMLYINGAWRASPHLRAIGAFLACFIWTALMFRALANEVFVPSAAIWPVFLMFDSFAAYDAARDARGADDKAKSSRQRRGPLNDVSE